MSLATYHIAHLVGLILLIAGIGAMASGNRKGMMFHGIGLLLLLIAGFGMVAVLKRNGVVSGYGEPWLIAKFAIFALMGALPVLVKRKVVPSGGVMWLGVLLGGCAAYLGYLKGAAF